MERYAVFLDIDGTLMSNNVVSEKNVQTIRRAQEAGHKIFVNTGRSRGIIPKFIHDMGLDGFVAGIGSQVVCDGVELKRVNMSAQEACEVFGRVCDCGMTVIFEGEVESLTSSKGDTRPGVVYFSDIADLREKSEKIALTKGYVGGILSKEDQQWFDERYNFFQHSEYAEFSHKGCDKSGGMKLILDFLNIPVERCVAVGDSINDLDMLRFAGISVAMGNANDEIKRECTLVTDDVENSGVATALEKILKLT